MSLLLCILFVSVLIKTSIGGESSINFLAIGDWGGQDPSPYTTVGQNATSVGMGIIGELLDIDFIVGLGDNFYGAGIPNNDADPSLRFTETWLDCYTAESLKKPWYIIAGNHDHNGNVTAQIDYTLQDPTGFWTFPSLYHSHSFKSSDESVSLDLILIDTVDIVGLIASDVNEDSPEYFNPLPEKELSVRAQTQIQWLEDQLAASTADYIIVAGHYPVFSICSHGNTATLITLVLPLLQTYQAHFLAGHDHCLEHLVVPGVDVNYFVSGTGKECCYDDSNIKKVPTGSIRYWMASDNNNGNTGGFASFTATSSNLEVVYYNQDAIELYSTTVDKRNI